MLLENDFQSFYDDKKNINHALLLNPDTNELLVAEFILKEYEIIPEEVRNELLLKLSISPKYHVAIKALTLIVKNYDFLPENIKNIIFNVNELDRGTLLIALKEEYLSLSNKTRLDILKTYLERPYLGRMADFIAFAIEKDFDNIPEEEQDKFFSIKEDKQGIGGITKFFYNPVKANFNKIPKGKREHILFRAIRHSHVSKDPLLQQIIIENYEKLPEDFPKLIFQLAREKENYYIKEKIKENFEILPVNVREELLGILIENEYSFETALELICKYYHNLPTHLQNLLYKYAESDNNLTLHKIARNIILNFEHMPEKAKELLFTILEKDLTAWYTMREIVGNYTKFPAKAKELLFNLVEKNFDIMEPVKKHFDSLPSEWREYFIIKLKDKPQSIPNIISTISKNFSNLPDNIQNLFYIYAKNEEYFKHIVDAIIENYNTLPEKIQGLLMSFIDKVSISDLTQSLRWNLEKYSNESLPIEIRDKLFKNLLQREVSPDTENLNEHYDLRQFVEFLSDEETLVPQEFKDKFNEKYENLRENFDY
jgi:hypothetical protein